MADVSPIDETPTQPASKPIFSDDTYNKLKFLCQVVLPAAATLYGGLAVFWNLPHGPEVMGSITLVATFIGALLGISSRAYNTDLAKLKAQGYDGVVNVTQTPEGVPVMSLETNDHPLTLVNKDQVLLKVTPGAAPTPENFGEAPDLK